MLFLASDGFMLPLHRILSLVCLHVVVFEAPVTGPSPTIAKSQSQPLPVLQLGGQVLLESLIKSEEGKSQEQVLEIIR